MLEEVPVISFFPSISYGLVIILRLTDENQELVKRYSGLEKVADLICYSQTVNFAFIEQRSVLM